MKLGMHLLLLKIIIDLARHLLTHTATSPLLTMQVNFSTLIEVSISFNGDADAAADYVIHNVLPNSTADDNNASMNDDSDIHGKISSFLITSCFHLKTLLCVDKILSQGSIRYLVTQTLVSRSRQWMMVPFQNLYSLMLSMKILLNMEKTPWENN